MFQTSQEMVETNTADVRTLLSLFGSQLNSMEEEVSATSSENAIRKAEVECLEKTVENLKTQSKHQFMKFEQEKYETKVTAMKTRNDSIEMPSKAMNDDGFNFLELATLRTEQNHLREALKNLKFEKIQLLRQEEVINGKTVIHRNHNAIGGTNLNSEVKAKVRELEESFLAVKVVEEELSQKYDQVIYVAKEYQERLMDDLDRHLVATKRKSVLKAKAKEIEDTCIDDDTVKDTVADNSIGFSNDLQLEPNLKDNERIYNSLPKDDELKNKSLMLENLLKAQEKEVVEFSKLFHERKVKLGILNDLKERIEMRNNRVEDRKNNSDSKLSLDTRAAVGRDPVKKDVDREDGESV